jgi:methionyl-tRNA formyltransferase
MTTEGDGAGGPVPLPPAPRYPRRLVYLGTPGIAVAPLEALCDAGFDVALVISGEDKRRGRRAEATATPVKVTALSRGIPVSHDLADATSVGADLGVVVAYGRIIRRPILEVLPMVNVHFSLLPRWRGAAPVERAILAADERTGVCVMRVEEGLDTGGTYACADIGIRRTSTGVELADQLSVMGADLLVRTLRDGLGTPEPQAGEPTYASKITREDRHLAWERPAVELARVVRIGGAWTTFRGKRLKVRAARAWNQGDRGGAPGELHGDRVATGDGVLQLVEVQPEGRGTQSFGDWANGARPADGERLGLPLVDAPAGP